MKVFAVTIAGIGAAVLAGAALAAPAEAYVRAPIIRVPCSSPSLVAAVNTANTLSAATLRLAPNCTYSITTPAGTAALPQITGQIAFVGGPSTTIRRDPAVVAAFRIIDVGPTGVLRVAGISIQNFGTTSLDRTLVVFNRAANGGGGPVTLRHSIVRANTPNDCFPLNSVAGCPI
jgi:hypothetical protein